MFYYLFQLTLPVWGATQGRQNAILTYEFQLTLPVWGATTVLPQYRFSFLFQLTLPVWGATVINSLQTTDLKISTHAPRVGSDQGYRRACRASRHFNSRSPCGERRRWSRQADRQGRFQLTLPVWGATVQIAKPSRREEISTHAPPVGGDKM